jgi:predicted acetylornithine/succinylornithine family transaminase
MTTAIDRITQHDELTDAVMAMDSANVMHTYARIPVLFTKGTGQWLFDSRGKKYLDFLGGIAVNAVGHCHPKVVEAVQRQAAELIHTSNLYYTAPQAKLAAKLTSISDFDRVFFCNSGAEANEAALKIARKHGRAKSKKKTDFVTAYRSFHGRTMATVTATAQPKYQEPFRPLIPGFTYVEFNDTDALRHAVTDCTCAVILEPIQGEGGVYPADAGYLKSAREICDSVGALLIFDEVQTGMGRTGDWWAYQGYGVVPDVMTSAKALGGGLPIGACLAKGEAAETFVPGDHGSTFAGNPLAASAALAVIDTIESESLRANAANVGRYLADQLLSKLAGRIVEVRGKGLMVGVQLKEPIAKIVLVESLERGLIVNAVGDSTLRFLPPLLITADDVDLAVSILEEVIT